MEAIILCGGLGTRLRSVVSEIPKPMAPIAGRPFLDFQLKYWAEQGIDRFILAVSYKAEYIMEYFGNSFQGIPVEYSVEEQPLGTGGAIREAMELLSDHEQFLLLNGDTFFDVILAELTTFHNAQSPVLTFSCYEVENNDRYTGLNVDEQQIVTGLDVKAGAGQSVKINGGVYLINRQKLAPYFSGQPEKHSFEQIVLPGIVADCGARAWTHQGYFIDIGIPRDFERAQTEIMEHIA